MKIGDRVKFLNDTGGGIITRFLEPDKVLVKIEDGFEVPTMLNQLMPDTTEEANLYQDEKNSQKSGSLSAKVMTTSPDEDSTMELRTQETNSGKVYLAFIHDGNPFHIKTYLINDTNYYIYYILGTRKMELQLLRYSGLLEPNTKMILGSFKILKAEEPTIFSVQYIGYKKGYYEPMDPVSHILELNTCKLIDHEYENENDFFDVPASVFEIIV